jgi:hypothetical protein
MAAQETGATSASDAVKSETKTTSTPAVGPWHIVGLALIVTGIVLLVLILQPKWNEGTDTVTGVLAVVIPAFATVGAAIFGATVAYSAGKATGETAGKAEGEANKAQAVQDGKEKLAAAVLQPLKDARGAVQNIVPALSELPSAAGERHFLFDARAGGIETIIPIKDVGELPASVDQAIRRLEEELPN